MDDLTTKGVGRNRIVADLPMVNVRVRAAGQSLTIDRAEPVSAAGYLPLRGEASLAEFEKMAASEAAALHLNAAQQARLTIDLLMSGNESSMPSTIGRIAATIQQLGSEIEQGVISSVAAVDSGRESDKSEEAPQGAAQEAAEVPDLALRANGGGGDSAAANDSSAAAIDSGNAVAAGDGADGAAAVDAGESVALADNLRSSTKDLHAQEQISDKAELEQSIARLATSLGEASAVTESEVAPI